MDDYFNHIAQQNFNSLTALEKKQISKYTKLEGDFGNNNKITKTNKTLSPQNFTSYREDEIDLKAFFRW